MTHIVTNPIAQSQRSDTILDRWIITNPTARGLPEYWTGQQWTTVLRDARQYRLPRYAEVAFMQLHKKYPDAGMQPENIRRLYVRAGCDKLRIVGQ